MDMSPLLCKMLNIWVYNPICLCSCVCPSVCLTPPLLPPVFHPVECSYCHTESMMGFRYRCQQCHNYQLCQDCFWRGHASGSHSNQHQMKEYTSWVREGEGEEERGGLREVCLHWTIMQCTSWSLWQFSLCFTTMCGC